MSGTFEENTNAIVLSEAANAADNTVAEGNAAGALPSGGQVAAGTNTADLESVKALDNTIKQVSSDVTAGTNITTADVQGAPITEEEFNASGMTREELAAAQDGKGLLDPTVEFEQMLRAGDTMLPSREQYLTANQPIHVGNYSGKVIGNVPIYAAPQGLVPLNIIANRQKNLSKAAAARKTLRDKSIKLLDIDVPEQWQNNMNERRNEVMERYGKLTNYKYELLQDHRNPIARKFHEEVRNLQALDATVTDMDKKAEEILTAVKDNKSYVPDKVKELAIQVRNGAINLDELLTKSGRDKWTDAAGKLQTYQNATEVMQSQVVTKIKANKTPIFMEEFEKMTPEEQAEKLKAFQVLKLGGNSGKSMYIDAVHSFYPKEEVDKAVKAVFDANNVWKGFTGKEAKELLQQSKDYVWGMLGEELVKNKDIVDLVDRKVSVGGSSGYTKPVVKPPYANLYTKWNDSSQNLLNGVTNMANEWASSPNPAIPMVKDNETMKQARKNFANGMGLKPVEDGSGEFKAKIVMGGGQQNWAYKENTINIADMRLENPWGGGKVDPQMYVTQAKEEAQRKGGWDKLSPKVQNTFAMLTGTSPSSTEDMRGASADMTGVMPEQGQVSQQHWVQMIEIGGEMKPLSDDIIARTFNNAGGGDAGKSAVATLMNTAVPTIVTTVNRMKWDDGADLQKGRTVEPTAISVQEEFPDLSPADQKKKFREQMAEYEEGKKTVKKKGRWREDQGYSSFEIVTPLTDEMTAAGFDARVSDVSTQTRFDKGDAHTSHTVNQYTDKRQFNITIQE